MPDEEDSAAVQKQAPPVGDGGDTLPTQTCVTPGSRPLLPLNGMRTLSFGSLAGSPIPASAADSGCRALVESPAPGKTGSLLPCIVARRPPLCLSSASPTSSGCREVGAIPSLSDRAAGSGWLTPKAGRRKPQGLVLRTPKTPSSCTSFSNQLASCTPQTPELLRADLKCIDGEIAVVLFDFDGTLTASPGEKAQRLHCRKQVELQMRRALLAPRLHQLKKAGLVLGIISKSSELTLRCALREAELSEFFDGPIVARAIGFEGKAGIIEDMVIRGSLRHLGPAGVRRVLLVDDDIRELDRARSRGLQTYPAPVDGGLQEDDLDELLALALGPPARGRTPLMLPHQEFEESCVPTETSSIVGIGKEVVAGVMGTLLQRPASEFREASASPTQCSDVSWQRLRREWSRRCVGGG